MIVEVELKLEIRLQGRFHRIENLVTLDRLPENTTPAPSVGEPGWLPILLGKRFHIVAKIGQSRFLQSLYRLAP